LTPPPTAQCAATLSSPVGSGDSGLGYWNINVVGGGSANYNIIPVSGKLYIDPPGAEIVWGSPAAIYYGGSVGAVQLNAYAIVAGQRNDAKLPITYGWSTSPTGPFTPTTGFTPTAAGDYYLQATCIPDPATYPTYSTVTAVVKLVVNPAPMAILVFQKDPNNDANKVYYQDDFTAVGFSNK
jgi:hypothetical protein